MLSIHMSLSRAFCVDRLRKSRRLECGEGGSPGMPWFTVTLLAVCKEYSVSEMDNMSGSGVVARRGADDFLESISVGCCSCDNAPDDDDENYK